MNRPPTKPRDEAFDDFPYVDESGEARLPWQQDDPETLARKLTDPLIESFREKLRRVDVSKFKKNKQ